MKNPIRQVFLALSCLTLIACGGGGGGGSGDSGGSDDSGTSDGDSGGGGSNSGSSDGINPGVSGKFFYVESNSAHLMDISTGEYFDIPNTDWINQDDLYPLGITQYSVKASPANSTFMITARNCRYHTDDVLGGNDTCVVVQDLNGSYITDPIIIDWDLKSDAEPSPDGQYFAAFRELDDIWLEIWDIQGNRINGIKTEVAPFEWLADGRLIYIYEGRNFIITDPYSTNYSTSWSLPESFEEGDITRMSASPDGTKIAFNIHNSGTLVSEYTTFWMLDVDTGSIRQIATNPEGEDAFRGSAWSPDGSKIAVLEGGSTGSGPDSPGVATVAYVLPADSNEVLQLARYDESLRSPGVVLLKRFRFDDIPTTSNSNSTIENFSGYFGSWLPE